MSDSYLHIYNIINNFILVTISVYMLCKKTVHVKKHHFYVKELLFYIWNSCKNIAFLQKHIFVKQLLFYVKSLLFYKNKVVKSLLFYRNIFL